MFVLTVMVMSAHLYVYFVLIFAIIITLIVSLVCSMVVHKKCHKYIITPCTGQKVPEDKVNGPLLMCPLLHVVNVVHVS